MGAGGVQSESGHSRAPIPRFSKRMRGGKNSCLLFSQLAVLQLVLIRDDVKKRRKNEAAGRSGGPKCF
jgi:hypothetical protein